MGLYDQAKMTQTTGGRKVTPEKTAMPQDYNFVDENATANQDAFAQYQQSKQMPQMNEVNIPEYQNKYGDYESMLNALEPKPTPEKELKRQRARKTIAALGDGISAVANVIGTSQGGLNMYNPQNSLSAAEESRYQQMLERQKADRAQYMKLRELAQKAEEAKNKAAVQRAKILNDREMAKYKTDNENARANQKDYMSAVRGDQIQTSENRKQNFQTKQQMFTEQNQREKNNIEWAKLNVDKQKLGLEYYKAHKQDKPDVFAGKNGKYVCDYTPAANTINTMLSRLEEIEVIAPKAYDRIKNTNSALQTRVSLSDEITKALSTTDPEKRKAVHQIMVDAGYRLER